ALPDLNNELTLRGPGANWLTVARDSAGGTPDFRIFTAMPGSTVTISGLTVRGGQVTTDGGGVLNMGTLTLVGVAVAGNSAEGYGGGIENLGGTLTLSGSTV